MVNEFDWSEPPLDPEDQKLIDAYLKKGIPLDALAYTDAFDEIAKSLGKGEDLQTKHAAFRRLLTLRKRGRLPRLGATSSSSSSGESSSASSASGV